MKDSTELKCYKVKKHEIEKSIHASNILFYTAFFHKKHSKATQANIRDRNSVSPPKHSFFSDPTFQISELKITPLSYNRKVYSFSSTWKWDALWMKFSGVNKSLAPILTFRVNFSCDHFDGNTNHSQHKSQESHWES